MKAYKIGQLCALVEVMHERTRSGEIFISEIMENPDKLNKNLDSLISVACTELEEYSGQIRDLLLEIGTLPTSLDDEEKESFKNGYQYERIQLKTIRYQIGNAIAKKRIESGLTQHQLCAMTGISQSNLGRIEKGRYTIGIDVLEKIALAMNNWDVFKI